MPKRLLLLTALVAAVAALIPAQASAATCWKELVNDYWADNRVDHTYPIACYREAMESLPADVQQYSDAQDDLRRALLAAIREGRDSGGGFSEGTAEGEQALPPGPTTTTRRRKASSARSSRASARTTRTRSRCRSSSSARSRCS